MKGILIGAYIAVALATLVFQIRVRSDACSTAGNCPLSYTKAVVWSAIWPASWIAYPKGQA